MTATEPTKATTGVPFTLNGRELEAEQGELLIDAAERNGVHIPRFCYHSRMTPVGMCRMCLVEVDGGRGPSLQPSCMLPVTPDMKVNTESDATVKAQDGVLELLLINHPLDCPVCDKGGECPLQDNAYAYGPGESRFVEEKRHYEKPIPISDLVHLDRERCILCDRCTRFADEVAGDPLIHFMGRGADTQVNTFPDHPFSSYFSGNVVQICPVGALTASPYRFKARPWDFAETESTATTDSSGARVVLQSSRDRLVRTLGVDSDAVNWSWLSDKERFSYEAANSDNRVTQPLIADEGDLRQARWATAARAFAHGLGVGASKVGVLGGARLPLEGQYAWSKLLKGTAGIDNIDAQLGDGLSPELVLASPRSTISGAMAAGSTVILLGADLKEELPTLFLRARHAATNGHIKLIELTARATSLSPFAAARLHTQPGTAGQVAAALAGDETDRAVGGVQSSEFAKAHALLRGGGPVTIIVGRSNLAESAAVVADATAQLQALCPGAAILPILRRGNINGALEMGLTPGFLPGGRKLGSSPSGWPTEPADVGLDAEGILRAAADGELSTLVLLGADPLADYPDRDLVIRAFDAVDTILAVDTFLTESSSRASVVLPAAMFGETDGSFMNLEGRVPPLRAQVTAPGQARADWMIAVEVADALGADLGFDT
ncbi:MAG: NADH-quinone oxidoreductase subunit NuoG [Acidimicrobiales bacterium]